MKRFKVKFIGSDYYLGSKLMISYKTEDIITNIELEIVSL